MNIQGALDNIRDGRFVARQGWGERVYIYLAGDLIMYSANGWDSVWEPPHPDLLASDWQEIIPAP